MKLRKNNSLILERGAPAHIFSAAEIILAGIVFYIYGENYEMYSE